MHVLKLFVPTKLENTFQDSESIKTHQNIQSIYR